MAKMLERVLEKVGLKRSVSPDKDTDQGDGSLYDHIEALAEEAEQAWRRPIVTGISVQDQWDICLQQYNGDQAGGRGDREGIHYTTIDRTQPATLAQVANSTATPPLFSVSFGGNRPDDAWYLSAMGRAAIQEGRITDFRLTGRQLNNEDPLPVAMAASLVAVYGPDAVIKATAEETISFMQAGFDKAGQLQGRSEMIEENELWTTVLGTGWLSIDIDDQEQLPTYTNWPLRNVRCDPVWPKVRRMRFVMADLLVPLSEAQQMFPKRAAVLERAAATGQVHAERLGALSSATGGMHRSKTMLASEYGDAAGRMAANLEDIEFQRKMVHLRIAWERGHRYPMTRAEAMERGLVAVSDQDENLYHLVDQDGAVKLDEAGEPILVAEGQTTTGGATGGVTGGATGGGWPTIVHIRQLVWAPALMGDGQIQNVRCPFRDVPVGHNVNIAMINSAYGIGTPFRLRDVQTAINRLATDLLTYFYYYRYPQELWPASLLEYCLEQGMVEYSHPGKVVPVEDELYRDYLMGRDNRGFYVQVPDLPEGAVPLLQLWFQEIDRLAGYVDVLQGRAPGAGSSGRSIIALQQEAKTLVGLAARATKHMLQRLGEIEMDAMLRFTSPAVWAMLTGATDRMKINAFLSNGRRIKWAMNVEVAGDDGAARELKKAEAREARARGDLSRRSYWEITGLVEDPDEEDERLAMETMGAALTTPAAAATMPSSAPTGGGGRGQVQSPGSRPGSDQQTVTAADQRASQAA